MIRLTAETSIAVHASCLRLGNLLQECQPLLPESSENCRGLQNNDVRSDVYVGMQMSQERKSLEWTRNYLKGITNQKREDDDMMMQTESI